MFNLFKKKKQLNNFTNIGVDMHSHILPGIDDGAKNLEESLAFVHKLHDLGFNKLIASPHIMGDYYRNTPEIINKSLEILQEALSKTNLNIKIEAAAEYYLDEFFEDNLDKNNILSFSNYVLFELSFINEPHNLKEMIFKIRDKGYIPVLAHPERYAYLHNSLERFSEIKEWGACLQLNTISLTGYYSKAVKKMGNNLLDKGLIDFIGSDAHHERHLKALQESLEIEKLQEKIKDDNGFLNHLL